MTATAETWRERVTEWKASGKRATDFAQGKPYAAGTLRWWSYRLGKLAREKRPKRPATTIAIARVVRKPTPTRTSSGLVLEVGGVRVRVDSGFDRALLCEVVAALGGAR